MYPGRPGAALRVLKGMTSTLKSCTPFIRQGEGHGHHKRAHFLPQMVVLTEMKLARSWLPQPVVVPSGHVAHVAAEGEGCAVTSQSRSDVGLLCSMVTRLPHLPQLVQKARNHFTEADLGFHRWCDGGYKR